MSEKIGKRKSLQWQGIMQSFVMLLFTVIKKIRLDVSCLAQDSRIHLKHQVLFSLKNNEKIFMNVICCSRD